MLYVWAVVAAGCAAWVTWAATGRIRCYAPAEQRSADPMDAVRGCIRRISGPLARWDEAAAGNLTALGRSPKVIWQVRLVGLVPVALFLLTPMRGADFILLPMAWSVPWLLAWSWRSDWSKACLWELGAASEWFALHFQARLAAVNALSGTMDLSLGPLKREFAAVLAGMVAKEPVPVPAALRRLAARINQHDAYMILGRLAGVWDNLTPNEDVFVAQAETQSRLHEARMKAREGTLTVAFIGALAWAFVVIFIFAIPFYEHYMGRVFRY